MKEDLSTAIIASMSDGLIVLDRRGYIVHSNPAALEKLNIRPEELADRTYSEIFLGDQENDAFNDILFDGIQNRATRQYREVPFRRRDGGLLELAVTTSFLGYSDDGPESQNIVVVFKDITELKDLDRARKRVLSHLSHELRTPLSIILASLKRLAGPGNEKTMARIYRSLDRLFDIQLEVEDIVKGRPSEQTCSLAPWVDQALDLVELVTEEHPDQKQALGLIKERIARDFKFQPEAVGPVCLADVIHECVSRSREKSAERDVSLATKVEKDAMVRIEPTVLRNVIMGLVRNAIENTPDGGRVTVEFEQEGSVARVSVVDTGTGITQESQKQIFGGFYHARETDLYSTKKPYQFGAGGKGLDLLRARIYGEMFGFDVECRSVRCPHIPEENLLCPGSVHLCPHITMGKDCERSGGSIFTIVLMTMTEPQATSQEV